MKTLALTFFIVAVFVGSAFAEEKKPAPRRLADVRAFPSEHREALRAVIAALSVGGENPVDFFVTITPTKKGAIEIFLIHAGHPSDDHSRGDACGKCRS